MRGPVVVVIENVLLDPRSDSVGRWRIMSGALEFAHEMRTRYQVLFVTSTPWLVRMSLLANVGPFRIPERDIVGMDAGVAAVIHSSGAKAWIDSNCDRVVEARDRGVTWPIWVCRNKTIVSADLSGISTIDHLNDAPGILEGSALCGF